MKTTIQDIINELKRPGKSMSEGRRLFRMEGFRFNGEPIESLDQEVELKQGDTFAVGKKWEWTRGTAGKGGPNCWVKTKFPGKDDDQRGIADNEGSLKMGQYYLVFPKFPLPCDYVRMVRRHDLTEIAYWVVDEWEENGSEVMGAIIGAMCEGVRGTRR
jgi:hypothetical protein